MKQRMLLCTGETAMESAGVLFLLLFALQCECAFTQYVPAMMSL